jgi:gliding motility-associated-like protein
MSVQDASISSCLQVQTGSAAVRVYAIPTGDAGEGGFACDLDFELGAIPSVGTGTWSLALGPGEAVFAPDSTEADATVTVTEYGAYTFTWTEINGLCPASSDITIDFYEQPVANAGAGGDACDLDFVLSAVPSLGAGMWTQTGGPGVSTFTPDDSAPNVVVTVTEYGSYQFTWTEVNADCSDDMTITVNFYEQPVADAGEGGNYCGLEAPVEASLTTGTGMWSVGEGPGTVTFAPDATSMAALATATVHGTYVLVWTETNGSCIDSDSVEVGFIDSPVANAGDGGIECDPDFELNAVPAGGNGSWSMFSGPGTASFVPDSLQPDAVVSVDSFGTYEFLWTVENIACTSTDQVTVSFYDLPEVTAGPDTVICLDDVLQLLGGGTGNFYWTPDSLVSDSAIARPLVSPDTTTTFILTVTSEVGCENSDTVVVEVREIPFPIAGEDQVLEYVFNTTLAAELEYEYERGEWTIESGSGELYDRTNPASVIDGLELGDNLLRWTVTNDVCPIAVDSVVITVNDFKVPTLFTPNRDGKNDFFVLEGIESMGKAELIIFDRLGVIMYEDPDYKNDWEGVDYNGNPLPDDTYFYVVNGDNGKRVSGFIVLRR